MLESLFQIERAQHCTIARSRSALCTEKRLHSRTVEMQCSFLESVNTHPHLRQSCASARHFSNPGYPRPLAGTHASSDIPGPSLVPLYLVRSVSRPSTI